MFLDYSTTDSGTGTSGTSQWLSGTRRRSWERAAAEYGRQHEGERDMTLVTDFSVFSKDVSSMCNYYCKENYRVQEFLMDFKSGKIKPEGKFLVLAVGKAHVNMEVEGNVGRQIARMLQAIATKQKEEMAFYVCGVIPWPRHEDTVRRRLMQVNTSIGVECRNLVKFKGLDVTYIPVHQAFLEKWKTLDDKSNKVISINRVKRPIHTYYKLDGLTLNAGGRKLFRTLMWEGLKLEPPVVRKIPIVWDRERIQVICNETEEKEELGNHAPVVAIPPDLESEKRGDTATLNRKRGSEASVEQDGKKLRRGDSVPGGRVSDLIQVWETRQNASAESLDVELGEDSIVQVNLGDGENDG